MTLLINGATIHHAKEMMYMRGFNFYLPEELFERIKLLSKFYNVSTTKIMVELLEIGYVEILNIRKKQIKNFTKYGRVR